MFLPGTGRGTAARSAVVEGHRLSGFRQTSPARGNFAEK